MEKTVNDLIKDLQSLKPELRELPVKIRASNGLLFEPKPKVLLGKNKTMLCAPERIIITY